MDKENVHKIDCTTITVYRNTKTGETFHTKMEGPDIATDVTVQITNKGLSVLQEVMSKKKT